MLPTSWASPIRQTSTWAVDSGVGKRAVAGPGRDAEEVGERGEADAAHASFEQAPRERGGAQGRLREPPAVRPLQLPLEEPLVEAGVVGDERCVAGEEDEALDDRRDGGCTAQLLALAARSAALSAEAAGREG